MRKQSRNSIYSEGGRWSALDFYENHFAILISLFSVSFHKTIILNRYYIYKVRGTPRKTSGKSFESLMKVPSTNYSSEFFIYNFPSFFFSFHLAVL